MKIHRKWQLNKKPIVFCSASYRVCLLESEPSLNYAANSQSLNELFGDKRKPHIHH